MCLQVFVLCEEGFLESCLQLPDLGVRLAGQLCALCWGKLCAPQCPVVGACWGFMVLRVHTELSASHLESRLVSTAGCDVKVWWEEVCVCV